MTIRIDEEFAALIPPLGADERAQLEQNLVDEGRARDPLVTWQGVLLDGHNRYEICERLGLPFDTREVKGVATRDEAKVWIVRNQLCRRNISAFVRGELALSIKPEVEVETKKKQLSTLRQNVDATVSPNSDERRPSVRTDEVLADMANVGKDTIRKIEKIKETAAPELLSAARAGDVSVNAAAEIATLPAAQQVKVLETGETVAVAKKLRAKKSATSGKGKSESPGGKRRKSAQEQEHDAAVAEAVESFDPLAELEEAQHTIDALNAQIRALSSDDVSVELARQIEIRQGVEARLAQETRKVHELDRQLRKLGKIMADLRKITGAETNSAVVTIVRSAYEAAA